MKKILLCLFLLFSTLNLFAFPEIGFAADLLFVQDFPNKVSKQFNADVRVNLPGDFEARLPVTFTFSDKAKILDLGVSINCYPFEKYLYFGISAIQFAYFDKSILAMNEVYIGCTFNLFKTGFFVEPELCIRDPSATYADEYSMLRGVFPSYQSFRIRLKTGYKF